MYMDNIDEQFRQHEMGLAVDIIEETIERCSMPFEHEELMDALDRIKQRLQYKYEKEQERKREQRNNNQDKV